MYLRCHPESMASSLKLEADRLSDQEQRKHHCKGSETLGEKHEDSGRGRGFGWCGKGNYGVDPFLAWTTKLGVLACQSS